MTTRTEVANYLAPRLTSERQTTIRQAAAWLIANNRTDEAGYLARDIAAAQARQGYLWVRLTTARPLTQVARNTIESYLRSETGTTELELEEVVNAAVIGGVHIETAAAELDATVRAGLDNLIAATQ